MQLTEFIEWALYTQHLLVLWPPLPALTWSSGQPRDEVTSLNQIVPWSLFCFENSDSSTKIGTPLQIILGFVRSLRDIQEEFSMSQYEPSQPSSC